ncbi:MAG: hypothetical protein FD180_1192 [Planctomycetota bacterium]|nr:MAG: hypothetical protein FD180_1192 [Planctomycetota bacterium]
MRLARRFHDRGFVILVALGILGVLGLLAAAFATLSRVERAVSASYVDKVRARLLADSGVERALAAIRARNLIQAWDDTRNDWYYREMLNGPVGSLTYSPATIAALGGYTPSRPYGAPSRRLEQVCDDALLSGVPAGLSFGDPARAWMSGSMPGSYEIDGDFYAVKAVDCASQLFVNDQNPQIQRLLNNLGAIVNLDAGLPAPFKLGDEMVAAAKARNKPFAHKGEVLELVFIAKLGSAEGRARFGKVRDFISCHAWVDYTTMHFGPKPAGFPASAPPTPADIIDRGGIATQFVTASGAATKAAKFGGTNQWKEPRAPINVNTASREVLVAMLWGLTAKFVDYDHATAHLVTRNIAITQAQAEVAADHIINARYTFGTPAGAWSYNDWMHFRSEVIDKIPGLDRFQKSLIHANGNPNTDIRKMNPDLLLVDPNPLTESKDLVRLDKSDITQKSTEWCFSSMGLFEIESLGRVVAGGKVLAQERVETIVKIFDAIRITTQEQFEKDRSWTNDDPGSGEGDLYADGFPPIVSMPEYPYNNPLLSSTRYKSATNDVSWASDYDGYLTLNGPVNILSGMTPLDFNTSTSKMCRKPLPGQSASCAWNLVDWKNSGKDCMVSGVWGFNLGKIGPNLSHATKAPNLQKHVLPNPTNPEYAFTSPDCEGTMTSNSPANSLTSDTEYKSAGGFSPKRAYQIQPTGALNTIGTGFFEDGADIQPFGLYVNYLKRRRFHTIWGDELPTSRFTVEFVYKPEIDHWEWAKGLPKTAAATTLNAGPCSRMHLWGLGAATHGTNYEQWVYVQGSRVFYNLYQAGKHYVIYRDHDFRAHTWHHIEISVMPEEVKTLADGSTVTIPPNAMLFVDGKPASGITGDGVDVASVVGKDVFDVKAMALPTPFIGVYPNNDWGTGPRMEILSKLQFTGSPFGMSQPSTIGTIDNLVIHHWRSHDTAFTPRNRFHSMTYFDGTTFKSGKGYKGEKAGVYKKRLTAVETAVAGGGEVTIGTVMCTHYHPWHVHLYGHDGAAPTTSFGHITPSIRTKTGGSYLDSYYYDGCAGLPVKTTVKAGTEVYYLGWFEVAAMVPVVMSPILDDLTVTYFAEPKVLYRVSSVEAR